MAAFLDMATPNMSLQLTPKEYPGSREADPWGSFRAGDSAAQLNSALERLRYLPEQRFSRGMPIETTEVRRL